MHISSPSRKTTPLIFTDSPTADNINRLFSLGIVLVSKDTHKESILRNKAKVFFSTTMENASEISIYKSNWVQTKAVFSQK